MSLYPAHIRAAGYLHGFSGHPTSRSTHAHGDRYPYDAGYKDGQQARRLRDPREDCS